MAGYAQWLYFTTRKSEIHQLIDLGLNVDQRILELRDSNTVLRAERARLLLLRKNVQPFELLLRPKPVNVA